MALLFQNLPFPVQEAEVNCNMPVRSAGGEIMGGSHVGQCKDIMAALRRRSGVLAQCNFYGVFPHPGIVAAPPQVAPDRTTFTAGDQWAFHQGHVAFDTMEGRDVRYPNFSCFPRNAEGSLPGSCIQIPFLGCLDLCRCSAWRKTVKGIPALSTDHMATNADLIAVLKFHHRMGGFFAPEGAENLSFAKMAGGAGYPLVLQLRVVIRIRRQNRVPFAPVPKPEDQVLLLAIQWGVAVFANLLG